MNLDYIKQIKENYDKESKKPYINIATKIGVSMNSLSLMVIEARLLTDQIDATDELLVVLEKLAISQM